MSFTAGTKVLLASGAAIPISQLRAGDKVLATNTKAGKTRAQSVAAVLVNHDTNLYDLTIRTRSGSAVIHTTSSHPFFDLTRHRWVKAGALVHGDHLRSSDGTIVTVSGGRTPKVTTGWMWDLTVPGGGDHDFYIQAASTAVLVHNCAAGPTATVRELSQAVPTHGLDPSKLADLQGLSDKELLQAANNPVDGENHLLRRPDELDPATRILQGHHRIAELVARAGDPSRSITWDTRVNVEYYTRNLGDFFWDLP